MSKKIEILYVCDPNKNISCRKTICKPLGRGLGDTYCELTMNPAYKKDGTEPVLPLGARVNVR